MTALYPRYQDSGLPWVGLVPSDWEITPLLSVVQERNESNAGMVEDNLLSLSYGRIVRKDMTSNDGLLPESFETYQVVNPGDIVFRLTDLQNDKRSLRTALVEERGIITAAYLAVSVARASPSYLNYLFRAYDLSKVFYSMGGGLRQSMKFADLKRLPVLLPSPPEQTAIAAFLDRETGKIDALVEEQKRLVELLKAKRQAVISHAVTKGLNPRAPMKDTRIDWLGEVPEHWEVKRLSHLVRPGTSITYGIVQAGPDIEGGVPYIRTSDMSGDELPLDGYLRTSFEIDKAYARSRVYPGDLVIAIRATIGKPLIVPKELSGANLTQGTAKFSPGAKAISHYVCHFLRSNGAVSEFSRIGKGATFKEITLDMLRRFPILLPPVDEQAAICEHLSELIPRFDRMISVAETATKLLKERRAALISSAVTGKIDVRGFVESRDAAE
ncbi:restriction endonuclease subunit S [Rhizobium anhuiense]|uniref:restriction endonuclease subunit S n=1 Tax=Rhizobium anhuiense TaxID=1184720 RepID=UPI0014414EF4|nr:restriction endonuclease subunit S [Rhizobium anhuiense]NKM55856.1 restriction endonuclease subunit S [Rhizobium anhuiense]